MASEPPGILLDTSFFIRLMNPGERLHLSAREYFRFFSNKDMPMYLSTISIAEYCVLGSLADLPLNNLRILPFNLDHGVVAGRFGAIIQQARKEIEPKQERALVQNDAKLMAQVHQNQWIRFYATADARSRLQFYDRLKNVTEVNFQFLDISIPCAQAFGELDFGMGEDS